MPPLLADSAGLTADPPAYDASSCRTGATCKVISDIVRVNTSSNVTVVVFEPPETGGNGTCSGGLFDELSGSARTCQAGCCVDGACVCREGFVGARCEAQLRCGGATSPGDSLWDFDACETISLPEGQSRAICSCTGLEFVSVLSHRLRPASALLDALDPEWSEWPRELHGGLENMTLAGWLWVCIPLVTYVLMMCGAWVLDQRECYSAVVPHWALPGERGFPLWRQCATALGHGTPHVESLAMSSHVQFCTWRQVDLRESHPNVSPTPPSRVTWPHRVHARAERALDLRRRHAQWRGIAPLLADAAVLGARRMCATCAAAPPPRPDTRRRHLSRHPLARIQPLIFLSAVMHHINLLPAFLPHLFSPLSISAHPLHAPPHIADAASAIGGLSCGFPALLARLAFLITRDDRTKRSMNRDLARREELFLLKGLRGDAPKKTLTSSGELVNTFAQRLHLHQLAGRGTSQVSSPGGVKFITGNEPTPLGASASQGSSGGLRRRRRTGAKPADLRQMGGAVEEELCCVYLRPSQLTMLSDGVSLGFELPGASAGPIEWRALDTVGGTGGRSAVPAVQIGVPLQALCSWRSPHFCVQYAPGALHAYEVEGVTCTRQHVERMAGLWERMAGRRDAKAREASFWGLVQRIVLRPRTGGRGSPPSPERPHAHHLNGVHEAKGGSELHGAKGSLLHRTTLSRWGCSTRFVFVWTCNALILLLGWSGLLLLALVAVPRSGELRGLSDDAVWRRARSALTFGLLNLFIIIDVAKVIVIVGTGPGVISLLVRIRSPRVRFVVRKILEAIYLPVVLVCP